MDQQTSSESRDYELPKEVAENRTRALEVLNAMFEEKDAELDREINQLKIKHSKFFNELHAKWVKIISGEFEPTEEDLKYPSNNEGRQKNVEKVKENSKFWLKVLKKSLGTAVEEHDEPVLSHLEDIKVKLHDSPMGYTLEFHFSENEYFTDNVLTKYFEISVEPSPDIPNSKTARMKYCQGSNINWNKGKNVTVDYEERTISTCIKLEIIPINSFFNFFNYPTKVTKQPFWEVNVAEQNFITGQHIINFSIPKSIQYYTLQIRSDKDKDRANKGDIMDSGFVVVE